MTYLLKQIYTIVCTNQNEKCELYQRIESFEQKQSTNLKLLEMFQQKGVELFRT